MDAAWFTSSPIQYYVSDHLGSAHYTLDGHQNLLSHTEFFPSGELWIDQLNQNYTQTPRWSFTGKEWDADTGLYDFGARQYDPRVGQWLSPDPILASLMGGSPNGGVYYPANLGLYSYCYNNPANYVDPDGRHPILIGAGVGAFFGLGVEAIGQVAKGDFDAWRLVLATGGGAAAGALSVWSAGALSFGAIGGGAMPMRTLGGVVATFGSRVVFNGAAGGGIGWYQEGLRQSLSGEQMNSDKMAQAAKWGAVGGAVGSAAGEFWALAQASKFNALPPGGQNQLFGVGRTTREGMTEAGIAANRAARTAGLEAASNVVGSSTSFFEGLEPESSIGSGSGSGAPIGTGPSSSPPSRKVYDQKLIRMVPREAIGN